MYKAANQILRMALEGKICLALEPPNFDQKHFENNPDTALVREVLGKEALVDVAEEEAEEESSSEYEDEDMNVKKLVLNEYPPHKRRQMPPNLSDNSEKEVVYKNPFDALADDSD